MELALLHAPADVPFEAIQHVALGVRQIRGGQRHVGVLYRSKTPTDAAGEIRLLHLAWHHDLQDQPAQAKYSWVEPRIPSARARVLARLCARLADVYQAGERKIAYALRYSDGYFHPETGEFLTTDGHGLTCATFVLAVFASRRQRLVRSDEWPFREEDAAFHEYVVSSLRQDGAGPDDIAAVVKEHGCARFRPEEIAAAGTSPELPVGFEYAERVGKRIAERLAAGRPHEEPAP